MPQVAHAIELPPKSVEGRIGVVNRPNAFISTDTYCSTLCIRSNKDDKDDSFSIDVDLYALINAEDKEHHSPIPTDAFKGTVDGVHVPTGRFENPTEAGWTIRFDCEAVPSFWCAVDLAVEPVKINVYKETLCDIKRCVNDFKEKFLAFKHSMDDLERSMVEYQGKISGIKRSIDQVDNSPVKVPALAMPPPPSPVEATPSPAAASSQPPKISHTMSYTP